jgi:hypothetical protein
MKLNVRVANDGTSDVWVYLTEREADRVANALRSRLDHDMGHTGPGYHLHLEDNNSELTIAVLDPE